MGDKNMCRGQYDEDVQGMCGGLYIILCMQKSNSWSEVAKVFFNPSVGTIKLTLNF